MLVLRVTAALDAARVPYAIVGGYAVALHGAVRGTVDLDLVLRFSERHFIAAEEAFQSISLAARLPVRAADVFRFREDYIRNRNLLAWSFVNPAEPSEVVDIILTHDLAGMKVKRVRVQGRLVKLASVEDLIRMKTGTGRPQDAEDVRALRRLQ